jgi:hypothetical protein
MKNRFVSIRIVISLSSGGLTLYEAFKILIGMLNIDAGLLNITRQRAAKLRATMPEEFSDWRKYSIQIVMHHFAPAFVHTFAEFFFPASLSKSPTQFQLSYTNQNVPVPGMCPFDRPLLRTKDRASPMQVLQPMQKYARRIAAAYLEYR